MAEYKRSLRNFLILPNFQLRFLGYFVALFFISSLCFYSAIYLFFHNLRTRALAIGVPKGHVFFLYIDGQQYDLNQFLIYLVVLNFILLIIVGLVVSHRVAGPIYKLKKFLAQIDHNSPDFKLRSKDYFKELEPIVNDLKSKIKE
jgi:hypothetical protein